jgi:hypothetical protein
MAHTQRLAGRGPLKALVCSVGIVLVTSVTLVGADEVAFNHVTVIDVVEGRLNPGRLVRISGERIV